MEPKSQHKYTNHLIHQGSPYLLLHAHNPVDWFPWGPEALEKAQKENKLLVISIGYAACHWCHVMEEESFSDEEVAEVMNKYFVSIKVDREERPDLDQVYMDAAHLLTGRGGWPLNAIALPDGRPVFAGTYFPKPQWIMILTRIHDLYESNPTQLEQQADSLTKGIQAVGSVTFNPTPRDFDPTIPDQIFDNWKNSLDFKWGGEQRAPKFPLPIWYRCLLAYHYHSLDLPSILPSATRNHHSSIGCGRRPPWTSLKFLIKVFITLIRSFCRGCRAPRRGVPIGGFSKGCYHLNHRKPPFANRLPMPWAFLEKNPLPAGGKGRRPLEAVKVTLDRMAMGGIYDQVGGGFARYSTDEQWKVPHFEKMLYDNGQLVSLYSYAFQLTQDPLYKTVVYETLEFVDRELTSPKAPQGGRGFYSSLDADSEGEEGKFYLWTKTQVTDLLGKDAPLIIDYYNITGDGNWENGRNILFRAQPDETFAAEKKISVQQLQERVAKAKKLLLAERSRRVRPALDDKILTAWNALMLTGYVDAYRVFDEAGFLKCALKNAEFLINHMISADGRLNRNYKNGKPAVNGFLDDYAFTIQAFIALYQATFEEKWLFTADRLLKYTLDHFYDPAKGMFYYTSDRDPGLIARKMEITDNVIPSSNSQMAVNLYLLGEYFYHPDYLRVSKSMLGNVRADMVRNGPYYANWGLLSIYFIHPPAEVAIVGDEWEARRKELDRYYLPGVILMGGRAEGKLPLLQGKLIKGQTTIFVCKNKACLLPVTGVQQAVEQVRSH